MDAMRAVFVLVGTALALLAAGGAAAQAGGGDAAAVPLRHKVEAALKKAGLSAARAPQRAFSQAADAGARAAAAAAAYGSARAVGLLVKPLAGPLRDRALAGQAADGAFVARLAAAAGVPLSFHRTMSGGRFVLRFAAPMDVRSAAEIVARAALADGVESVDADAVMRSQLVSTDPYFPLQWNLLGPETGYPGGIEADLAWNLTTGTSATVVAVVDTGVIAHPEFGARLLPGFDFVSDTARANDGNSRDSNAADPGDWQAAGECAAGESAHDSSWHGTHVAGIIGADGANGSGTAGVSWKTRILPVRVLGKCGGTVADIIDGIRWAAGLAVPGVPTNQNPAQVINLSLGGFSPQGCSRAYQEVINDALGQGALVVVAAGNSAQDFGFYTPANCEGVLTVVALDPYGDLASYSNYSFAGQVAAPGGDITRYGAEGSILSTVSAGRRGPSGFEWNYQAGTSMAAPHVSGIAALALTVNPNLSGAELVFLLELTSNEFPSDSQCRSLAICGSGIASAYSSVLAAELFKDYSLIYEFYNVDLNHYFRTGYKAEAAFVNKGGAGAGWYDTIDYFYAWSGPIDGAVPVCRFYGTPGRGPNSHFYTANAAECAFVKTDPGWTYEGISFYARLPVGGACPTDTTPVWRVYNNRASFNDSNHRYTTDRALYDEMAAKGWGREGLVFCAAF